MADTYGLSTLLVAAVAGGAAFAIGWRRPFFVQAVLLILLLFHEAGRRLLSATIGLSEDWVNAISRWWVLVIVGLLAAVGVRILARWIAARRVPRPRWPDVLLGMVILWGMWSAFTSPNLNAGIAAFRNYFQPMGVFILARSIQPSASDLRRFTNVWLAAGVLLVAVELWQVTSWTAEDYRARGYVRPNGELVVPQGMGYLRPSSTVTGPNELGLHMVLLSTFGVQAALSEKKSRRWLLVALSVVYVAGLAVSQSRSAFLALVAALLISGILHWRGLRSRDPETVERRGRSPVWIWLGVGVGLLVALLATGMLTRLALTVQNLSQEYHFEDTFGAVQFLLQHPEGVGMGMVGPREGIFFPADEAFHVEGSLFQIAMEMGVIGLALWLAFLASAFAVVWARWRRTRELHLRTLAGTGLAVWLGALVAFLFLPLMQAMALMCWLWFLLGTGMQVDRIEQVDADLAPTPGPIPASV